MCSYIHQVTCYVFVHSPGNLLCVRTFTRYCACNFTYSEYSTTNMDQVLLCNVSVMFYFLSLCFIEGLIA